jgi:trehalose-phosphatase
LHRKQQPRLPRTEPPAPLPRGLLAQMATRGPLLVCLDYDGTISEIVPHPADARPLDGVAGILTRLADAADRVHVAIVTGRELAEVRKMLGVSRGVLFSGTHGLEIVGRDGQCRIAPGVEHAMPDLEKARAWLNRNIEGRKGFVLEDKRYAIAMHYRMADAAVASELRAGLHSFLASETSTLSLLEGKKVDELMPRGIGGKGHAVRTLLDELGDPHTVPIYFGDDTTDEDAFREIREDGLGVLVGPPRASWAHYRVDGPRDVTRALEELAQALADTTSH